MENVSSPGTPTWLQTVFRWAYGRVIASGWLGAFRRMEFLFRSAQEAFGSDVVGVLLTGMGKDGAEELKYLRDRGAITFAQDEESCVIFGMPAQAIQIGAVMHVLPPDQIGNALATIGNKP
jgi:chemotaxis response regulator CheB